MSQFNPLPDLVLAKKLNRVALLISIIVLLIVASLRKIHISSSIDFGWLAGFHSTLNGITALGLVVAFWAIKRKKIDLHKKVMILNMIFSGLFLISYVIYHITTQETRYCGAGGLRMVYFVLLISHIFLAGIILPLILFTFIRAYTGQISLHKKLAKWTFPLWLYIAISGPILYLMLRPCFTN